MNSIENIQSMLKDLIGSEKMKRAFAANYLSEIHFSNDSRIDEAMKAENFQINTFTADLINWMLRATKEEITAFEQKQVFLNSISMDELMQSLSDISPETTEQHELLMVTVTCAFIFEHLGESILSAEKEVIKMLNCNVNSVYALNSIKTLGGNAHIWANWFFETLDESKILNHNFFAAFASICRQDKPTFSKLCDLLTSSENFKKIKVIRVLGDIGSLTKSDPKVVPILRNIISLGLLRLADEEMDPIYVSILSLAKITTRTDESIPLFIDLSHSSNIYIKGMTISALEEVNYPSSEIVLRLGELFESFVEYDSDMTYEGEKSRVANAIEKQGALAAPLVSQLITHIKDLFGNADISVVKALGAIGPKAIAALPYLKELTNSFDNDDLADESIPIIKAIRSIEIHSR
jgi:hypothetical protein